MDANPTLPPHVLKTAIYDLIESIQETFKKLMLNEGEPIHLAVNNLLEIWLQFTRRVITNRESLAELQTSFWQEYLLLCQDLNAQLALNPAALKTTLLMSFIGKFYFLTSQQIQMVFQHIFPEKNAKAKQKIAFYNRQFVEAFAGNNFINTSLDAVYAALAESL